MGLKPYLDGFQLVGPAKPDDVSSMKAAAVNIAKGDVLIDNGAGFVTNASITAFSDVATWIAIEPCNNSAGVAGDLSVLAVPISIASNVWIVPNASATVAAQTDVGEIIDLESEDDVDVTDTSLVGWGFIVEEIDISAAALVAKAGGFVRGRFVRHTA